MEVIQQIPRTTSYMCEVKCAQTGNVLCEGSLQHCNAYITNNGCEVVNRHVMDYVKSFPYNKN